MFRLDVLSCVLTILSTILIGKRHWEGWVLAAFNSAIICIIGFRTAQWGLIPANIFCIAISGVNLHAWRKAMPEEHPLTTEQAQPVLAKGTTLVVP